MGPLLAQVIPLALGAAISPVLFLLQLSTLTGSRPVARGSALAIGAAIPLLALGAVGVVIGSGTSLAGHPTLKGGIDIGFGALLLLFAARAALRSPAPPKPKREHSPALRRSFLLGVVAMATNVTSFAFFVPALKLIVESGVGTADKALATLVVWLLALSFVVVPLVLAAVVPGSTRALSAIGDAMTRHRRALTIVLCVGFGAWLVVKGIVAL